MLRPFADNERMPRFSNSDRREGDRPGRWDVAAVVADTLSAQALMGLFASEGVPARMQSDTALLGAARECRILVPREMIQRARCVLWQTRFSDEELAQLAVGQGESGQPQASPPRDTPERR
jgi:hypothetical protein